MPFVPLCNRTAFTFYSGAMDTCALVTFCVKSGYPAAGLCDRNGLYAAIRFYKACATAGIKSVIGVEFTGSTNVKCRMSNDIDLLSAAPLLSPVTHHSSPNIRHPSIAARHPQSLFCFARDLVGYSRLCEMVSKRNLRPDRFDLVAAAACASAGGRVAVVASDPSLLHALQKAGVERGSLFAGLSGSGGRDAAVRTAAGWLGIAEIAAPLAGFTGPEGYVVHRALRAIKHKGPELAPTDCLLAPEAAAERFSGDLSRAAWAAGELAASCDLRLPLGDWIMPHPPIPPGETEGGRLKALAYAGMAKRLPNVTMEYLSRLDRELEVIIRLGFAGYFLVVEDIARFARSQGIPNIGRGSGAGSLTSYCLFLTHVDPVREGLYFERFLNQERRNPPDIDLDFSWRERDHVIRHVYDSYGEENVCMISTHNTFSARSGFREAGKVFGLPEEELGIVARAVPHSGFEGIAEKMASRPESRKISFKDEPWRSVMRVARWVDGFPRHLSVHCGGVVVSPIPLTERLSLERSAKGVAITQCDMYDVEEMGLVKIDLLGNRSLGVLVDAVASVKANTGKEPPVFPPEKIYADRETNAVISGGMTMGCFYIESPGMRLLLKRLRTRTFPDLTAVSSIIRPGVSESGMMDAYIARRLCEEPARYAAPGLEPILRETFGVMVYQEDVIRVAHEFVGLSLGEADLLRRAMSGKYRSQKEMDSLTGSFFRKGAAKGIGEDVLKELWRQIRSFAGYAFCKAHSASFAQLSYQVAYLKAHHPAEFFAALVNNQGGFYGTAAYVEEARRWGLSILPPDSNLSEDDFAGRGGLLRCGFLTLAGVRSQAMDAIYEERGEGHYRSFSDLCSRLRRRVHPSEIGALVRAGAFDSFGEHRGRLLWLLANFWPDVKAMRAAERGNHEWRETNAEGRMMGGGWQDGGATSPAHGEVKYLPSPPAIMHPASFGQEPPVQFDHITFSKPPRHMPNRKQAEAWGIEAKLSSAPDRPLSLAEILSGERGALGFCPTAHPLTPMLGWAEGRGYTHAISLPALAGETARAWGQVITYKRIPTRKTREGMAFATLEDPTGLTEIVFFPKAYSRFGELITGGRPLVVEGKVQEERGGLTVTVERAAAVRSVRVQRAIEDRDTAEVVA